MVTNVDLNQTDKPAELECHQLGNNEFRIPPKQKKNENENENEFMHRVFHWDKRVLMNLNPSEIHSTYGILSLSLSKILVKCDNYTSKEAL